MISIVTLWPNATRQRISRSSDSGRNCPFSIFDTSGRRHDDREIVDLLFFPTGGGKTEAYLGLAAFKIAHRRITYPGHTGAGVTVIMRYTLRLLTLDQLGRAAGVVCALELARLDDRNVDAQGRKLLGDWPIEIGLWVGSAASPNRFAELGLRLRRVLMASSQLPR